MQFQKPSEVHYKPPKKQQTKVRAHAIEISGEHTAVQEALASDTCQWLLKSLAYNLNIHLLFKRIRNGGELNEPPRPLTIIPLVKQTFILDMRHEREMASFLTLFSGERI